MRACCGILAVVLAFTSTVFAEEASYPRGPVPRGGEIYYASFDHGARPDSGIGLRAMHPHSNLQAARADGRFVFVEGQFGQAIELGPDRVRHSTRGGAKLLDPMAGSPVQGEFCNRVGTLSFWFRTTSVVPNVFVISQSNDKIGGPRLVELSAKRGVQVARRDYSYLRLAGTREKVGDNRWHHAAIVWDEYRGVRFHLDGHEVASNWGGEPYQTGYLSVGSLNLADAAFDEVRIFDVALSSDQIASLAQGERRLSISSVPATAVPESHRLEHLGWNGASPESFIPVTGPTRIRRIDLAEAKALRISGWRGVDGRQDSVWPIHYHGYEYLGGGALHLKSSPGEEFNFLRVAGLIDAASVCVGDSWTKPADATTLARLTGERFIMNYPLSAPCRATAVSVYPEKNRTYYWQAFRQLHDLALLDVGREQTSSGGEMLRAYLTSNEPESVAGDNRVRLVGWYRPEERVVHLAATSAPEASSISVEPLRFNHIMLAPQSADLPLGGVRLQLKVDGWESGNLVNVRLHDSFNLWRELIDVDVRLEESGRLDLSLAFPSTILPKGTELWLTLVSRQAGRIQCGKEASTITLFGPTRKEAETSYLEWQHRLLKDDFAALSEPRPWGKNAFDDAFLRAALPEYDAIARIVWDLYRRFPEDRRTLGYMLFTHPRETAFWKSLPAHLPEDPNVPRWALLEKELLGQFLYYVHWWIEHRQTPDGELGNFWGDDTDLVGDWVSLSLICDPDGKIRGSQRMVADPTWTHLIRNGLNIRWTDALHAYEDGNNTQPYAFVLDYGNPVLFERLLATARRYDGFLVTPPENGKRRMAGNYYCDSRVGRVGDEEKDSYIHLILHAGHTLSWYNGHSGLTRMMTELFDGTEHSFRATTPSLPHALYLAIGDRRFALREPDFAQSAIWARLMNLTKADIDAERLQELVDYQYEKGMTSDLGNGSVDALRKYVAWHYTRDKSHLVPALEALWKQTYYTMPLRTETEQSGDRVAVFKNLTDIMYLGGFPGARAHLVPTHAVSYEGLSPNFAALVLDATGRKLRWVGFNFEDGAQTGKLRVWNLVPGTYRVSMGPDNDADDQIDYIDQVQTLDLKRFETIPIRLPSKRLYIVEAECVREDVPLYDRCDLAVTDEDAVREGSSLVVKVHNLGCRPSGPFHVEAKGARGRVLASREHPGLEGVGDLHEKTCTVRCDGLPRQDSLQICVQGPAKEITEVNNMATIPACR